jgi:hypothetical protein
VFGSWGGKRAVDYRRQFNITPAMANGTAVNICTMVFGNRGDDSGTGVGFTRDPGTGENVLYGKMNAVAQVRTSVEMEKQGIITKAQALLRVAPDSLGVQVDLVLGEPFQVDAAGRRREVAQVGGKFNDQCHLRLDPGAGRLHPDTFGFKRLVESAQFGTEIARDLVAVAGIEL